MDYDEYFQAANHGVKPPPSSKSKGAPAGSGGRGYPVGLDGGYASPPTRPRTGGGIYSIVNGEGPKKPGGGAPPGSRNASPSLRRNPGTAAPAGGEAAAMVAPGKEGKDVLGAATKSPPFNKFRPNVPQVSIDFLLNRF